MPSGGPHKRSTGAAGEVPAARVPSCLREETSPPLGGTRFMEVGLQFIFQNTHEGLSDQEMMLKETEIVLLAEEVGMDFALLPEHHFDPGYAMMPDNMQWLSYLAGRTSRI